MPSLWMEERKREREKTQTPDDILFEQRHSKDNYLYHLISQYQWDDLLELLTFKTELHEETLRNLISHRRTSPLFLILRFNDYLCEASKKVCLRLMEIGGKEIVRRKGDMHSRDPNQTYHCFDLKYTPTGEKMEELDHTPFYCACKSYQIPLPNTYDYVVKGYNVTREEFERKSFGGRKFATEHVDNLIEVMDKMVQVGGEGFLHEELGNAWNIVLQEKRKDLKILEKLLELGARETLLFQKDKFDFTALHRGCGLLYHGSDDFSDLYQQQQDQHMNYIQLLLDYGGQKLIMVKTSDGETALDFVAGDFHNNWNLTQFLFQRFLEVGGDEAAASLSN